jgi:hypothetical protein
MHLKRHVFALALLLTLSFAVQADKVDDYVKAQMERQHVPGVSITVIKDMKIVKSEGYGLANSKMQEFILHCGRAELFFRRCSISRNGMQHSKPERF